MDISALNDRKNWTVIDNSFDETVAGSVNGMYTMLAYNNNKNIRALITYSDSYILEYSMWASIYFYNDEGKCYNKIEGHLGYAER